MKQLVIYSILIVSTAFLSCEKVDKPTCFDLVKNQNEQSVDCGGVCTPCPSCKDNILNQDEDSVDCGGVCGICASCQDGIKNQTEIGVDCGGTCEPCNTNACTTPLGFGDIAYLAYSSGRDTINDFYGYVLDPDNESGVKFYTSFSFFPRGSGYYECRGFNVRFYGDAILKTQENLVQVFTTASPDNVYVGYASASNKCVLIITMPGADLVVNPGQKIYVTKLGTNKYNIRFCKLPVPKLNEYNFTTTFSSNLNFSFN